MFAEPLAVSLVLHVHIAVRLTSVSLVVLAAFANSPAARSCSSLAAIGFALWVSMEAFRAWEWA